MTSPEVDSSSLLVVNTPRQLVAETLSLPAVEVLNASNTQKTQCFLCPIEFNMFEQREAFLAHSITTHKLVIGDVELISDLSSYVAYWRSRFETTKNLAQYCAVIKVRGVKHVRSKFLESP